MVWPEIMVFIARAEPTRAFMTKAMRSGPCPLKGSLSDVPPEAVAVPGPRGRALAQARGYSVVGGDLVFMARAIVGSGVFNLVLRPCWPWGRAETS